MTIDTACSSSMVSVHEAVQALRSGTSELAVACGTNLLLSAFSYITESKLGMLSPTGRSRMWDAAADGYARGEGVACVVLKRLSTAIADGDKIEAVIREIGVNHDGKTKGLTMPSAAAQAALIRNTYARAGLDPTTRAGRCQFFEAHGTGTPAGDPQEAEALSRAFFPEGCDAPANDMLYVGSIKTVTGHTEGTAGLAGIMKAVLALQSATIPPNLLFEELNPTLLPFVDHLRIATSSQPWPEVPAGAPRRASVNSFGFGGTNAHAIIETYTPEHEAQTNQNGALTNGAAEDELEAPVCVIPCVMSAASEKSLAAVAQSVLNFLGARDEDHDAEGVDVNINLPDLAWTMSSKRSALAQRLCISATSVDQLREKLQERLSRSQAQDSPLKLGVASLSTPPSILGVFTGQGAQWATMGKALIQTISLAREVLARLDESLARLPVAHRPAWKLEDQLSAPKETSRLSEAALSQPLCTAVQIILVDLLRLAGVRFRAVVGHSSGEIAAAYAAGFLSAVDAIRIAYYRGLFAPLASGAEGQKGGMLAAGTSIEDAEELCAVDAFAVDARLFVAAHNSPSSVTLSGNRDAVDQALEILEEEGKFARTLRVDTAYHSAHMQRCAPAYLAALQRCRIAVLSPEADDHVPLWFSSVRSDSGIMGSHGVGIQGLDGQYWVDNMTKPVLFHPAVIAAATHPGFTTAFNLALEVGPHPALQGPAKESIQAATGKEIPYSGTLRRGGDDMEAFADSLGFIWSLLGPAAVDLGRFQETCGQNPHAPRMVHGLPSYPWDHERSLWVESRSSKLFRTQPGTFHDLLGVLTADGTAEEWRWRNVLKIKEIKWLSGHALQGQTVFPGTGYIAMAMEAGLRLAKGRPVQCLDLLNLRIIKAIAISDAFGTELTVSMTNVKENRLDKTITADYAVFSTTGKDASQLALNCAGQVRATLGDDSGSAEESNDAEGQGQGQERFAKRTPPVTELAQVDVDRFYQVLKDDLGYGYDGPFRALTKIQRRSGFSTATIQNTAFEEGETDLLFHPGMLDSALQGLNAACSAPGDGRLWSIVAPTYFRRVSLIPALCGTNMADTVEIDCIITDPRDDRITGDVDVYSADYEKKVMEIEGVRFSPFAGATSKDDRHLFQETLLCLDEADAELVFQDGNWISMATPEHHQKGIDAERAAFFYLKNLHLSVSKADRENLPWYRKALISNAERLYDQVKSGSHPHAPASWIDDTHASILAMMDRHGAQDADFNLTKAVGEHLLVPSILSGESSILEHMAQDNYLDRYYIHAIGFEMLNHLVSGVMKQLCAKHPRMRVLEIGAGTGGATQAIFSAVGNAYASYTYTDISSGFFDRAADKFRAQPGLIFKTLDVEDDPMTQGYSAGAYDVIVASNVLHATRSMKKTLEHTRKLLRPGGYLVLLEVIRSDVMRHGLVMGGLQGWWVGFDDGRTTGPSLTLEEWDSVLRETGFGGIETSSPMPDPVTVPGSVFVARATSPKVSLLAAPLGVAAPDAAHGPLVILGGQGDMHAPRGITATMVGELSQILGLYFSPILCLPRLEDLPETLPKDLNIISLIECDSEGGIFADMDEPRWEKLKTIMSSAASVLWLLRQSRDENPHGGTTLGLFRTLFYELPGTLLQSLDLGQDVSTSSVPASMLAELILRLKTLTQMVRSGESDKLLWNFEPELVLQNDGRVYAPRVRQNVAQNARYNSAKREIKQCVDTESAVLELVKRDDDAGSYMVREKHLVPNLGKRTSASGGHVNGYLSEGSEVTDEEDDAPGEDDSHVTVRVSCSLLSSLKTPAGYFFIQIGRDVKTGHKLLCFSSSNTSEVTVPRSATIRADEDQPEMEIVDGQYMSFVVAELMSQQILNLLPPSGIVLAYEPDPTVASLLAKQLSSIGRRAIFVTSKPDAENTKRRNWVYLHPHSSKRAVDAVVAASGGEVTLYFDASEGEVGGDLGSRIPRSLSELCEKVTLSSLSASTATQLPADGGLAPKVLTRLLRKVAAFASSQLNSIPDGAPLDILPLKRIPGPVPPRTRYSLVYWQVDRHIPVSVEPVFKREDLFRPDRTYWLAGLGGDLGRSLADFMIARNARHVVISSRTPIVDQGWVDLHRARGATVVYRACDLTDFSSAKQVHDDIVSNMPPIGGVANGAMVLRDVSFVQMDFESLNTVLRSKVLSSTVLDRLFSATAVSSRTLDWFVGFSSIVGTTGNPGQAAYSAGNVFMKTLVRRRRARGLPGSTIDICRVIGVGYIERESSGRLTREHQARLATRSGTLAMSEVDLHQLFAEAIVSGRPTSGLDPEIISGLAPITVAQAKDAFWAPNPKFGLIIREEDAAAGTDRAGAKGGVPVRQLLEAAKTMDDVSKILLGAFKAKLQALMFLPEGDSLSETTPLVDVGVDSLVGVEMRSWFLQELGVDVPVMKILGGASVSDLVEGVMQDLPEEIKSKVGGGGGDVKETAVVVKV